VAEQRQGVHGHTTGWTLDSSWRTSLAFSQSRWTSASDSCLQAIKLSIQPSSVGIAGGSEGAVIGRSGLGPTSSMLVSIVYGGKAEWLRRGGGNCRQCKAGSECGPGERSCEYGRRRVRDVWAGATGSWPKLRARGSKGGGWSIDVQRHNKTGDAIDAMSMMSCTPVLSNCNCSPRS
jgi:hypothetical protein